MSAVFPPRKHLTASFHVKIQTGSVPVLYLTNGQLFVMLQLLSILYANCKQCL